jgi:WD40 repeat protein
MGVVYQARHLGLKRVVALKMILAGEHAGSAALTRFVSEAEAVAALQHVNIVQVFDIGRHNDLPYMALEFINGGSLHGRLRGGLPRPMEAAWLVEQVARGMAVAHDKGIIHRDLKPHNILLAAPEGRDPERAALGKCTPKVTDFGLAKKLDTEGQTQTGAVMGTPSYMAPEQARGKKEVGPAADVYALGAILYECLTGRPPFLGATPLDTLLGVVTGEPAPIRQLQPKCPRDLETVCHKCLNKDPTRRYATALHLAEDLKRFSAGLPVQARPVGNVERLWRWCRRNPVVSGLLALVAVTLLMSAGLGTGLAVWALAEKVRADNEAWNARDEQKNAADAAAQARKDRDLAQAQTRRAETLLADMYTTAGLVADERGEPAHAALWFATAAALPCEDQHRARTNRLRFQLWSRRLPQPRRAVMQPHYEGDPSWILSWPSICQFLPHPDQVHLLARSAVSRRWNLWDMAQEKSVSLPHQDESICAAAWSNTGDRLAMGTKKGRCLVLTWPGRKVEQTLPAGGPVSELALSRDGRWLAVARGREVRIWDLTARTYLGPGVEVPGNILWLVFDHQGKRLAIASTDDAVRVYRLKVPQPEAGRVGLERIGRVLPNTPRQYHPHTHIPPVWVNEDRDLLTSPTLSEVGWWDANTGKEVRRLKPGLWSVDSILLSPDGIHVAVSGWFGCHLYHARSGAAVGPRIVHGTRLTCAAFSPDGKSLLTGSDVQTVRLWSVPDGRLRGPPLEVTKEVYATAFLGNGLVAGHVDGLIRLWRPGQATLPFRNYLLSAEDRLVDYVPFVSPTGRYLLTRQADQAIGVVDLETGKAAGHTLTGIASPFQGAFLGDRPQVVIQTGQTVRVWDWQTGRTVWGPLPLPAVGHAVDASPDGRWIVSMCGNQGSLREAATGKQVAAVIHEGVMDLANRAPRVRFSPEGTCFASFGTWNTVTVWETRTGRPRFPPLPHNNWTGQIAFSRDGRHLATGSNDNTAHVWDLMTGKELAKIEHPNWVNDVAFSEDGRRLLTACRDGSSRLWDWREGKLVCPPMGRGSELYGGLFLPGTSAVATRGLEREVRIWDSLHGKLLAPPLPLPIGGAHFRIGVGRQVLALGGSGKARVFDLSLLEDDNPGRLSREQLRRFAEVQSIHTIHKGGDVVRLTTKEWLERWRQLREERPALMAWPEQR